MQRRRTSQTVDLAIDVPEDDAVHRRLTPSSSPSNVFSSSSLLRSHSGQHRSSRSRDLSPSKSSHRPASASTMSGHKSVLPSFLSRPGKSKPSLRLIALFTIFLLFIIVMIMPSGRTKGKAAVDSIGDYAGQAWEVAGVEWDKWVAPTTGSKVPVAGGGKSPKGSVRARPQLHADKTKSTQCEASHDGKRSVVQYAIMIDAGSTGSRVHVYKFNYCKDAPELEDEVFEMLRPGLSSFKGNPKAAADSLRPLLTTSLASIPKELQSCTPIAVKATAGLRLLGPADSKAILHEVRRMLKEEYPFLLADGKRGITEVTNGAEDEGRAVEIMEGKDEGVFAWITVNYLLGLIGPPLQGQTAADQAHTAAVMDLGGASTQIVFEPKHESGEQGMRKGEHVYELKDFGGRDYTLYQNSYLGYGLMQARKSINSLAAFAHTYSHPEAVRTGQALATDATMTIPSPCFALGSEKEVKIAKIGGLSRDDEMTVKFTGTTGGFSACKRLVEVMMDKDAVCGSPPCSFAGVYQPSLMSTFRSGAPIMALSYFYDRLSPLGLGGAEEPGHKGVAGFTIGELAALAEAVCSPPSTWQSHFPASKYPEALKELNDRPESCLDLTYLHSLLSLGYELEDVEGLMVKTEKKIAGTELGWSLGAAVGMIGEAPACKA